MISVHFQGKPFCITVILVYAPTTNAKKAKAEQVYEDLQDFLELTPKKKSPFHHRGLECKSRKSRSTWKFGLGIRNEAGQRLIEFCQENALVKSKQPLPTTQEMTLHMDMDITRWSIAKSD